MFQTARIPLAIWLLSINTFSEPINKTVTIYNNASKLDINGSIVNAHEGVIKRWNNTGPFYYYAMTYELCNESTIVCDQTGGCAHTYDHNVSIWSTPDLTSGSWKFETFIFDTTTPNRPTGVYFRPFIFYNKHTQKYVLWITNEGYNLSVHSNRTLVVLQSDNAFGPFVIVNTSARMASATSLGDMYGFQDDNDNAYIIYSITEPHPRGIAIDKLSQNYLYSSGETSKMLQLPGNDTSLCLEGPLMFKRNNIYYVISGYCCCNCKSGSDANLWMSENDALGPYKYINDIGGSWKDKKSITHSQLAFLSLITQSNGEIMYLIAGGMHQQAPDGKFGHDPQIWQPLEFDETNNSIKTLKSLEQIPTMQILIEVDTAD